MTFKDYFSRQSADYARFRPRYPDELIKYLSELVENRETAWDCATGNGQVATALSRYFERVYASDGSQAQISNAELDEKVEYFISVAESTPLPSGSIDLIAVAQAFHWFEAERFFTEAKRVLKPGGIIALWCYDYFQLPDADEALIASFTEFVEAIEPFWPPERQIVKDAYRSIAFPFEEILTPGFFMEVRWTAEQTIGYLCTWSALQRYLDRRGEKEIAPLLQRLETGWGECQRIRWSLPLRVGSYREEGDNC